MNRIRFIVALVLLISMSTIGYAQVKSVFIDSGLNLSRLNTKYLNSENGFTYSAFIDIGKDFQFTNNSFLYGKFGYWQKGGGHFLKLFDKRGSLIGIDYAEYALNYLLLSTGYSFHTTGRETIYIFNAGSYIGYLFSGNEDYFAGTVKKNEKLEITGDRYVIGLDFSIGLQFPIADRINLGFDLGYQFELIRLNDNFKNITYYYNARVAYLFIY